MHDSRGSHAAQVRWGHADPIPAIARFTPKVEVAASGCWLWRGQVRPDGYGRFWDGERKVLAHRWSYGHHVGPIPSGMTIDHLCRVRHCVNPEHLEAVSQRENTLRGDTTPAANAVKTHCPRGHAYDEANTVREKDGSRKCRECKRERDRRRSDGAHANQRSLGPLTTSP